MRKLSFSLTGLHCAGCAAAVERAVRVLPGAADVYVNFAASRLTLSTGENGPGPEHVIEAVRKAGYGAEQIPEAPSVPVKLEFAVYGMHCAGCAAAVERTVRALPGAVEVYVNFAANRLTLSADPSVLPVERITAAVAENGFRAELITSARQRINAGDTENGYGGTANFLVAAFFAILLFFAAMHESLHLPWFDLAPGTEAILQFLLLLPILIAGRKFYTSGLRSLLHAAPNMDSLIACGTAAATFYSFYLWFRGESSHLYFDTAGMIVVLIMFGKLLEARSRRRASGAIRELMNLAPETALRLDADGERLIPVSQIRVGDRLRVRPGDRIPADGVVESGSTSVDESMLSGEAMPVEKTPGAVVTGASINRNGAIVIRATRVGNDTVLAKIIALVEDAQGSRPPIARLADRISGWFVWAVLGIALVTFTAWLLGGATFAEALSFALAVMVIACPCALGLATPIALIVGIGQGAKFGILIKSGAALETAGRIQTVIFDKTGTLTVGQPEVGEIAVAADSGLTADDLLAAAAGAEASSEHPLADAVVREAKRRDLQAAAIADFTARPGFGVSCRIAEAQWLFGNAKLMRAVGIDPDSAMPKLAQAQSLIYIARDRRPAGVIGLNDRANPGAPAALAALRTMGIRSVMLTGDNPAAARALADELGIDEFHAELLPGDKAGFIRRLQQENKSVVVAMVGDGINDAPALAQADVGIAIGSGTDVAMETADVVLMNSDLAEVPAAIRLSRATMRIIRENLFWAFFYNAIGIPLAAGLFHALFGGPRLNPVFGALAMAASSVSVVLNALRLRRFHP